MVIAGPGSGKTFTIVSRILFLIRHHHIPPEKILVITYTKAAALEMKERFEKALKEPYGSEPDMTEPDMAEPDTAEPDTVLSTRTRSTLYPHAPGSQGSLGMGVSFGTFHSICYHILKQSGVVRENSLIGESEKRKLVQVILGNMGFSSRCNYDTITALVNAISRMKNSADRGFLASEARSGKGPNRTEESPQAVEDSSPWADAFPQDSVPDGFSIGEMAAVCREYDRHLEEMEKIDFDDMIVKCLRLFQRPEILEEYRKRFSCILVDEFQDINPPQYEILKCLSAPRGNLFVVGDDDQAIYGFRGATPGIMQRFGRDFPGGKQIMLTENYRCGAQIVQLAERMISCNQERFPKKFIPLRGQAGVTFTCFDTRQEQEREMVRAITSSGKDALCDTAVIVRTNREAALYAGSLRQAGIAVRGSRIREEDIFHGFIMEDVTAFLSFLYEGRRREDFIRFMNRPNRFLTRMALSGGNVEYGQFEKYYEHNPEMLGKVRLLFRQLQIAEGLRPHLAVSFFRKSLGYDNYLRDRAGDERHYQLLLRTADQVQKCFEDCKLEGKGERSPSPDFGRRSAHGGHREADFRSAVRSFVQQKAEKSGNHSPLIRQEEGVFVLTMHGSKGLEFERVFLPDLNEGIIPGKDIRTGQASEEERRLLYVAVTRAKKELYLYCTRERGRRPSRYLVDAQILR